MLNTSKDNTRENNIFEDEGSGPVSTLPPSFDSRRPKRRLLAEVLDAAEVRDLARLATGDSERRPVPGA